MTSTRQSQAGFRPRAAGILAGLAAGLALVLAVGACRGQSAASGAGAPPGSPQPAGAPGGGRPGGMGQGMGQSMGKGSAPVAVIASTITPQDFTDRFTALGNARATESIQVTPRISSVISRINFTEGEDVPAGQLLVELDNKEIRADLAVAEASLQQSRSQFERSRRLADTRVISESQLEELEAKMKMDEAQVQAARARLDNAFIRAPFPGTVGLRRVSLGDLVSPEAVITTLDDTRSIRLEFTVPESFVAELQAGMAISAESSVFPGRTFTGSVATVDSRIDPVTRSVTVIAQVPNSSRLLKPGMFLTVRLERTRRQVLMVPEEALSPRQGRQYVFLVQDGHAVEREVEIGSRSPGLAEVRSGVQAGDVVVTEGIQRLRDGAAVQLLAGS